MGRHDGEIYDADYFLRGKETGKSLYEDYRWMPELTVPMAQAMVRHLGIKREESILDFGCARGYTVRAMRELGYAAWGYDISQWAIANADPVAKSYIITTNSPMMSSDFDWVIAKDVLEHVFDLDNVINSLMTMSRRGVFVIVPLSGADQQRYVVRAYEKDVTHLHRFTLATWAGKFMREGWSVDARYRVKGVKDNYATKRFALGNGFVTARRVPD